MPRTKKGTPPSYRLHKQSGQAVVTVRDALGQRRDVLLGAYGSPESQHAYHQILARLETHRDSLPAGEIGAPPPDLTVAELMAAFLRHAESRYANRHEVTEYELALGPVRDLYEGSPAVGFGPKALKACRLRMIDSGLCRNVVNRRVGRVKTVFKWATEEELIPGGVYEALRAVRALPPNTPGVRETAPPEPAFWEDVEEVLPHCSRQVAAMLTLQWLTGMRSGEVRVMRPMDLDRSDPECWRYRPGSDAGPHGRHKNAWRGQNRVIPLGPRCIQVIMPFLTETGPSEYLFDPGKATGERHAERAANRKTKVTPSEKARSERSRDRERSRASRCYTKVTYPQAVARACRKAGVTFRPYSLRHGRKMVLERELGADAARCVLGQKSIESTQHYGRIDVDRASGVMRSVG